MPQHCLSLEIGKGMDGLLDNVVEWVWDMVVGRLMVVS